MIILFAFKNVENLNLKAQKGGEIQLATVGSFGRINPFIIKGKNAEGLFLTFDTLYFEQPGTGVYYPLLAREVVCNPSSVKITLDPRARFHNGDFVTAHDLTETINVLKKHGLPYFKHYLGAIYDLKMLNQNTIEIWVNWHRADGDHFLHFIKAFPILCKKQLDQISDFSNSQHCSLMGTGPYMIQAYKAGKNIIYKRNASYWAKDLPIRQGKFNFDMIKIHYYKDQTTLTEAFKRGYFDILFETEPRRFFKTKLPTSQFQKLEFPFEHPYLSIQSLIFNINRPALRYRAVREAIEKTFNFEVMNLMFFQKRFKRANGIYHKEPLVRSPKSAEELLEEAGFFYKKGLSYRINNKGEALNFTVLIRRRRFEKILNVFAEHLKKIGVQLNIIFLEDNLYKIHEQKKNYDLLWLMINSEKNKKDTFINQFASVIPQELLQSLSADELEQYLKDQNLVIFMDYCPYIWLFYRQDRIAFPLSSVTGINVMENGFAVDMYN